MKIRTLLLIIPFLFLGNSLIAQETGIDSVRIKNTLENVFVSFKNSSFQSFDKLLFSKQDYLEISETISGKQVTNENKIDKELKTLNNEIEERFNQIIRKGESKGIEWTKIRYESWVGNSEEIYLSGTKMPKGFLVDCHLKISFEDKIFTIVGIQLWLINNNYKVYGEDLRGIFEIDLKTFIFADDMYLDEMEENGY